MKKLMAFIFIAILSGCGTLDKKIIMIDVGSTKDRVIKIMGAPIDRQFNGSVEAWQYCVSGAGFGYNDHKVIWFNNGVVTGVTTYRTRHTLCSSMVREMSWSDAPDYVLEVRNR